MGWIGVAQMAWLIRIRIALSDIAIWNCPITCNKIVLKQWDCLRVSDKYLSASIEMQAAMACSMLSAMHIDILRLW